MQNVRGPVYARARDTGGGGKIVKAVIFPLLVFLLALFTISNLAGYGTKVVTPMLGGMWALGSVVAAVLPMHRKKILSSTLQGCVIYCFVLLGIKMGLSIASGASSEMISATWEQPLPLASGNALTGFLQTMLSFGSMLIPGGYMGMLIKQLVQYRKTSSLQKTFGRVRDIRGDR